MVEQRWRSAVRRCENGRMLRRLGFAGLVSLVLVGGLATPAAPAAATIPASAPCGAGGVAHYDHVVWIVLENVGYSLVGSPSAPYLNGLRAACALATNDHAVSHPSLPNYLALTSGSTQGVTDDGEPSTHPLAVASVFSQLGDDWRALVESMPTRCDHVTSGQYAARHNPAVYFTTLGASCARNDVPPARPLSLGARFTFIAPNICDDMHSCPIATGDAWLRSIVPTIIRSSLYQSRSLALFITVDESDSQASNQVPTFVIAPTVTRGEQSAVAFTHYSLLRTTEELLRVPLLGQARSARSMVGPFHL